MKIFIKIVLTTLFLSVALFSREVATVTALNGKAFVDRDGKKVELILGDKLLEKDVIKTQDKSKMQIIFLDETIITIGKNSTFAINEYLFEDNQEPVAKFGMLNGAMRAITGKIGKVAPDKFSVKTKTATMGIRGTNFSILAGEDGSYQAYCTFGAISVNINGSENIVNQGYFIDITPSGDVQIKEFTPADLKSMKNKNFEKAIAKKDGANSSNNQQASSNNQGAGNDGQIDTTVDAQDGIVVRDISDSVEKSKLNADTLTTIETEIENEKVEEEVIDEVIDDVIDDTVSDLASVMDEYTSHIDYSGTFAITDSSGGILGDVGTASLSVNFGADRVTLQLFGNDQFGQFATSDYTGDSFSLTQDSPGGASTTGSAEGTFSGETGASASGSFILYNSTDNYESGIFDVSTEQTLN
ncbi:MAG: hypothetical protein ACJAWW_002386 [Sulfurimonas sp.]|jgi:hypothetical protein